MRAALWLLGLFGAAVAVALFAGNNQGTVTLFWPPWRLDLSLNMVVLLLVGGFVVLHGALAGLNALTTLPRQARRWRQLQKERAMHTAFLQSLASLLAGRFVRARKSALTALAQENALAHSAEQLPHSRQLRALAHMLAADSSHALLDRSTRDEHLRLALDNAPPSSKQQEQSLREGLQLRAARWTLDDRDSEGALERLAALPQGAARRTLALRIKLKASRLAGQTRSALETARLLGKHHAFSTAAAHSIVRGLARDWIHSAHDPAQLQQAWQALEAGERAMPELAIEAAQRLAQLGGAASQVRSWLLPAWDEWQQQGLPDAQALKLVRTLESNLDDLDAAWLARIESASRNRPRDARLTYLAGLACRERQLWGKAQQQLHQAAQQLPAGPLRASAWRHLAELAEQRDDPTAAAQAWKQAALAAK
ncbi:MAG: heme biosynthesis protein HemY [Comamonadaceae bacterium]|jgi:HemY protein|nr:heme biosynthesis protein HemY [Comamonadaceae bacterium]